MKKANYYYAPLRNMWGIWKYNDDTHQAASHIKSCQTMGEAKTEVYKLNGWPQTFSSI